MSGSQQAQALNRQLQELEQVKEAIRDEMATLRTRKSEIDEAIDTIEQLEDGSEIQVPLGGGAYVRAEVQNIDEILVSIGQGYSTERPREQAAETLERKQDRLDEQIDDLKAEFSEVASESEQLTQQAQQQLTQQMQGQGQSE